LSATLKKTETNEVCFHTSIVNKKFWRYFGEFWITFFEATIQLAMNLSSADTETLFEKVSKQDYTIPICIPPKGEFVVYQTIILLQNTLQ